MRKLGVIIAVLLIGLIGGFLINQKLSKPSRIQESETSEVLLQQIRKVLKVVTVEGEFSEIYTYDNIWHLFFYPAQKKALVRVTAKVLVGYDLEGVDIDIEGDSKTVYIRNIPSPKVLSLEKSLEYYDLQESRFNQFKEKDFNMIEKRTEAQIREKVNQSNLYIKAAEQLDSYLETLQVIVNEYGWEIHRIDNPLIEEITDSVELDQ